MNRAGGNVAPLADLVAARFAAPRQRHFAIEDNVRRLRGMRVVRIERVCAVLPDVGVKKTFLLELTLEGILIGEHFGQF